MWCRLFSCESTHLNRLFVEFVNLKNGLIWNFSLGFYEVMKVCLFTLHLTPFFSSFYGDFLASMNPTLKGGPLKFVNKFTYLGSSVSSTETDINTRLTKAWTAINRLSVIWKSDVTDKIKRSFSKQRLCRYCYMDALHGR